MFSMAGLVTVWWIPPLVEAYLSMKSLPKDLAWKVKLRNWPAQIAVDADGHVLVAGSQVEKVDGDSGHEYWKVRQQICSSDLLSINGDVFAAGSETKGYRPGPIAPPFSGPNTDFAMCKFSGKDGRAAWKCSFDGGRQDTDWAGQLVVTSDGNPVAAGFTPDDTHYFGCVAKLDARDGRMIWQYRTNEASVELWHSSLALVAGQGADVVLGSSRKSKDPFSSRISFWITRLRGEDGRPVWTVEFPPVALQSHMLTHLAATTEGDLIATGYHAKERGRSLVVARFAGKDGRVIWNCEQDAESHETIMPTSLVVKAKGGVFVGAYSWNGSSTLPLFDRWIVSLSASDGHRLWARREAGKPTPPEAGEICSSPKLLLGSDETLVCAGSVWNGRDVDVRVEWLSAADGAVVRSITFDGRARDHDLFRNAVLMPSGEIVVALESSRCPSWLKPLRELQYRLKGGVDWRSIERESGHVNDADPYNYDCILLKSAGGATSRDRS